MNSSRPWLRKGVRSVFTLSSVNLLSVTYRVYLPYNIFGDHVTSIFLTKFNTEWCLHFLSVQWSGWKTDKIRERRQTLRSDIVNVCLSLSDRSHSQPHGEVFKSRGLMLSHSQMKGGWGGGGVVVNWDRCTSQNTQVSFFAAGLIDTPVAEVLTWSV